MHVVFSSDGIYTRKGYYAKIYVSEGNCSDQMAQSKTLSTSGKSFRGETLQDKMIIEKIAYFERDIPAHMSLDSNHHQRQQVARKILMNYMNSSIPVVPMICPDYASIGNGKCEETNNKLVCMYDGGDCVLEGVNASCMNFECYENQKHNPCPKYETIGNGQCDKENFNVICSFDGGDCEFG